MNSKLISQKRGQEEEEENTTEHATKRVNVQQSAWLHFAKRCREYPLPDDRPIKKVAIRTDPADEYRGLPLHALTQKLHGYGTISRPALSIQEPGEVIGDMRMIAIRSQLDNMVKGGKRIVRSYPQTVWHDAMMRSMIHLIYGSNIYANYKYKIMAKYAMKRHDYFILIVASRQVGKSTAVAMFAAAVICHVPNIDMAIFANNKQRSQELMEQIHDFVLGIPGMSAHITNKDSVEMKMRFDTDGLETDVRRIHCYTASNEVNFLTLYFFFVTYFFFCLVLQLRFLSLSLSSPHNSFFYLGCTNK